MSKVLNLLKIGTKFKVNIEKPDNYSLDGVKNGDIGEVIMFCTNYDDVPVDDEYWVTITRQDGTVCEEFLISLEDMEILND